MRARIIYRHLTDSLLTQHFISVIIVGERKGTIMKKPETDKNTISNYEVNRKIRRDWNGVNPVTRVIPNKKKNPKTKHKGKDFDYE